MVFVSTTAAAICQALCLLESTLKHLCYQAYEYVLRDQSVEFLVRSAGLTNRLDKTKSVGLAIWGHIFGQSCRLHCATSPSLRIACMMLLMFHQHARVWASVNLKNFARAFGARTY